MGFRCGFAAPTDAAQTMNITVKSHVMVSEANHLADCAVLCAASAWPGVSPWRFHGGIRRDASSRQHDMGFRCASPYHKAAWYAMAISQ
jgi:hypothetical protein